MLYGVELVFELNGYLQIFNFGDEIGISTEAFKEDQQNRKIKITNANPAW